MDIKDLTDEECRKALNLISQLHPAITDPIIRITIRERGNA
jgi:hypothetical protein